MSLPILPEDGQMASVVNEHTRGHQENTGTCTLGASTVTTLVIETRIKLTQKVFLAAKSANAAGAVASLFVSAVADGSFTLTHASTATLDRIFDYVFHS